MIPRRLTPSWTLIRLLGPAIPGRGTIRSAMTTRVTSLTFLQAAHASVKGYEHWHRFMIRFETTRLDEP
jgi:hypothetical protein